VNQGKTIELRSDHVIAQSKLIVAALREGGIDLDHLNPEGRAAMSMALLLVAAVGLDPHSDKTAFLKAAEWCWSVAEDGVKERGDGNAGADLQTPGSGGEAAQGPADASATPSATGPGVESGGGGPEASEGATGAGSNPA
jgi:hypothetical protein